MKYRGFLLFELLMGISIFFISIGSILFAYRNIEENNLNTQVRKSAINYVEQELNRAEAI